MSRAGRERKDIPRFRQFFSVPFSRNVPMGLGVLAGFRGE
jgi:hypothetical protein